MPKVSPPNNNISSNDIDFCVHIKSLNNMMLIFVCRFGNGRQHPIFCHISAEYIFVSLILCSSHLPFVISSELGS